MSKRETIKAPDGERVIAASALPDGDTDEDLRERQEQLLDEGLEETFPASDPVAVPIVSRP